MPQACTPPIAFSPVRIDQKRHHLTETNADQMVQRHGPHAKLHVDHKNPFSTALLQMPLRVSLSTLLLLFNPLLHRCALRRSVLLRRQMSIGTNLQGPHQQLFSFLSGLAYLLDSLRLRIGPWILGSQIQGQQTLIA